MKKKNKELRENYQKDEKMELLLDSEFLKYYNQDLIAKSGIKTLLDFGLTKSDQEIFKEIANIQKILINKNPENIVLRNLTDYFLYKLESKKLKEQIKKRHFRIIKRLTSINREMASTGAKKIRTGSHVFVHSLNNGLVEVIEHAARYKHFTLNLVEHSPLKLGTKLSKKLKNKKLKINVYPDLAINEAIINSDLCFIGGEAILNNNGTIAKTGSNLVAELANKNHISLYVCAHTLKFDRKGHMIKQLNHTHKHEESEHDMKNVFEFLPESKITAYVSEHGIHKPKHIVQEIKFHNKWFI